MPNRRREVGRVPARMTDPRAVGLAHFQAGRFDQAIAAWQPLATNQEVQAALAEAYFRRSLGQPDAQRADDLRLALTYAPDDPRLHYHLALLLHRGGTLAAADEHYACVAALAPRWQGLARVRGLLAIERGDHSDPTPTEGLSSGDRQFLTAVAALLRGEQPPAAGPEKVSQFWRGLSLLRAEDIAGANEALSGGRPSHIGHYHFYYSGLAAALVGDDERALSAWQSAVERGYRTPWLLANVAAVRYNLIQRLLAEGKEDEAAQVAQRGAQLRTGNSALAALEVEVLDRAARAAVERGEWGAAKGFWEAARLALAEADGMGSPRPLLHNLALTYEALELWLDAAEAWRAMLRTKPRKNAASPGDLSAAQWAWVRRRVIECYKRANEPGEAVAVFRQALKADPDDVELRLELSDALLANEQPQAAFNEINRVLERDPNHVEALLRVAGYQLSRHMWYDAEAALTKITAQPIERDDMRESVAFMLGQLASQYNQFGRYDNAYKMFSEAASFAPAAYIYPINLARVSFNRKRPDEARKHLDDALRLGADQTDAFVAALDCWAFEKNEAEVRAVIARAEEALPTKLDFYIEAAASLFDDEAAPMGFSLFGPPKPRTFTDTNWTLLGQELLDRAVALQPDDPDLRARIASELMQQRPDIGLRYVGEAVRLAPDAPQYQVLQGLLQALSGDKKAARDTLQKAGRLARKQGNRELAERADQLRSQINSPFFGLALQMGDMFDDLDEDDDEWL